MGIKKGDLMVDAQLVKGDEDIILFTNQAYALRFPLTELSVTGIRTAGVRGINLKDDDQLVSMEVVRDDNGAICYSATQRGAVKRMGLERTRNCIEGTTWCSCIERIKIESSPSYWG